tara:strand:- start:653 stop:1174 length:522 start_codon:yes stop_codon:yes gene_type:complete
MQKKDKINKSNNINLYNNIVSLSRKKFFYTKFDLQDTFQNRINLIFFHVSFLFIKIKQQKEANLYKVFYQNIFDLIFKNIELNMREIGHGDVTVNKNMKFLVKSFYDILLNCEKYQEKNDNFKTTFLMKYIELNNSKNMNYEDIVDYFDKYLSFCFDLTSDSVLKGDLKFNYI